jgi:hypothetical protein
MKKLSFILIASFALVTIQGFSRVSADDGGGIPLSKLAGKYAETNQGSITVCFKPDFSDTQNCSTPGAATVPFNFLELGVSHYEKEGDICDTTTTTQSSAGSPFPPTVVLGTTVSKTTNYDPATGTGDLSFTAYTGGKCIGSKFNATGATESSSGTVHFVASDDGKRIDFLLTAIVDPNDPGDFGAFGLTVIELKQKD